MTAPGPSSPSPREEPRAPQEVTVLLAAWRAGDDAAVERLFPVVYDELRRVADRLLGLERPDHTLSATALVNEAFLRLVDQSWTEASDRVHFFAVAARAMRQVLVDYARRRRAGKRGGGGRAVPLLDGSVAGTALAGGGVVLVADDRAADELLELDDALTRLAALDERLARVVELRYFAGLTERETAAALGVTDRTVRRDWLKAKGWLYQALRS